MSSTDRPDDRTGTASIPLEILAQNEDFLVVLKPAGVPTEPDRQRRTSLVDDVAAWLAARGHRGPPPHALSRLDAMVSGAVTLSISHRGHALAPRLKAEGKLVRRYLAIALGSAPPAATWSSPIDGKAASTRVCGSLHRGADRARVSLLRLEPITGRTHQLRIHASRAGYPLLGDRRYGGPSTISSPSGAVCTVPRVLLHAHSVELGDLVSPLRAIAPVPGDFEAIWRAVGGSTDELAAPQPSDQARSAGTGPSAVQR